MTGGEQAPGANQYPNTNAYPQGGNHPNPNVGGQMPAGGQYYPGQGEARCFTCVCQLAPWIQNLHHVHNAPECVFIHAIVWLYISLPRGCSCSPGLCSKTMRACMPVVISCHISHRLSVLLALRPQLMFSTLCTWQLMITTDSAL